jgi:hypothetical protein
LAGFGPNDTAPTLTPCDDPPTESEVADAKRKAGWPTKAEQPSVASRSAVATVSPVADAASTNGLREVVKAVVKLTKNGIGETMILRYASEHVLNPSLTPEERKFLTTSGVSSNVIDVLSKTR